MKLTPLTYVILINSIGVLIIQTIQSYPYLQSILALILYHGNQNYTFGNIIIHYTNIIV